MSLVCFEHPFSSFFCNRFVFLRIQIKLRYVLINIQQFCVYQILVYGNLKSLWLFSRMCMRYCMKKPIPVRSPRRDESGFIKWLIGVKSCITSYLYYFPWNFSLFHFYIKIYLNGLERRNV